MHESRATIAIMYWYSENLSQAMKKRKVIYVKETTYEPADDDMYRALVRLISAEEMGKRYKSHGQCSRQSSTLPVLKIYLTTMLPRTAKRGEGGAVVVVVYASGFQVMVL